MQQETKLNNKDIFYQGENLDVRDKVGKWINGEVLGFEKGQVFIHYSGWHPKFDELIHVNSDRILKQWQKGQAIKLNNRFDAYHPIGGWLQARAIELGEPNAEGEIRRVKAHFFNYHPKYDMWVDLGDKKQVADIGEKSKAAGVGQRKRKGYNDRKLSELVRKIFREKLQKMLRELEQHNLVMKNIGGDGNCLFRSISDQLYGEETFHVQIRELCMKYILHERAFFQNYIVEDIEEYVERKSKDGEWGDDIEIEAISEIYAKPIQICAMSVKPIRTFHEDNEQNNEPMRLAYIGQCHYNSIKPQSAPNVGLLETKFGEFEEKFFTEYFEHKNSDLYWQNRNRQKFAHLNPLELAIEESLEAEANTNKFEEVEGQWMEDQTNKALEISENEELVKEIEAAQLKELEKRTQQEAIQLEIKKLQEKELQEVKKLSSTQQHPASIPVKQKPYWFDNLLSMGFSEQQIWFAIDVQGYDPDSVQNFLLDNN